MSHSFVVCAYGESPYLEECVKSLVNQSASSEIVIATSTPNLLIESVACKYQIPLYSRCGEPGIAADWNFAIGCTSTRYVTIAHQDDVYLSDYSSNAVSMLNRMKKPLLYFSDYGEIRDGRSVERSPLLNAKKWMMLPYRLKRLTFTGLVKRLPISFGNPICCPSVTYDVSNLQMPLFESGFRSNLDWDAWERFSRLDGSFVYDSHVRMYHRVHDGSETSACIADNARTLEDLEMLKRFWPKPIAKMINRVYSGAQRFN